MSTKKDLVEAHAFSRRRLVTAFVSGAPGGREVEPSRPGRTIVGGVALGVLVLAGGAIAGIFSGRPPDGWLDPGIVIEKETGNTYVITEESEDPVLRPVVGNTNARLIFGTEQEPSTVSAEDIAGENIGDDIGILGAPAILPSTEQLVESGWVACTADGAGTVMQVAETPGAAEAPDAGLVVRTGGGSGAEYWLIATANPPEDTDDQAFRYLLPSDAGQREGVLSSLDLPPEDEAPRVDDAWLNLWPESEPLDDTSFDIGSGPVAESADWFGLSQPARAGDLVRNNDQVYLVAQDAPARLSSFSLAVYTALNGGVEPVDVDRVSTGPDPATPDTWPEEAPREVDDGSTCAMLVTRDGEPPTVLVAEAPGDELDPELVGDGGVPAGASAVTVEAGKGAFVAAAGFGQERGPSPFVIDSKGVRYQVDGLDAIVNLGYGETEPRVVPDTWLGPFGCGVVLSRNAALGEPTAESPTSCESE